MAYPTAALTDQMGQMNMQGGNPQSSAPPQPGYYGQPGTQPAPYYNQGPPPGSYPAPQTNPAMMPPAQQYPPPAQQPMQQGMNPQSSAPPQPYHYQQPPPQQQQVADCVLPVGFNVMDAFRPGNVIALICKASGNPVNVAKGDVHATGKFNDKEALFTITIAANNGIILQNVHWAGLHIGIKGKKATVFGKKEKHTNLRADVLPDNYVTFESMENPGTFLGFDHSGQSRNPKEVKPGEADGQFFVRVEAQKHTISRVTIPFNRPSVYDFLRDESIIQLYLKGTDRYLAIDKFGNPQTVVTPSDPHTFFLWKDRGMGIVTLRSYKYSGYMMRMGGFVVSGKGDADINSDFRVYETAMGGVKFESVTCPGGFLAIADDQKAAIQQMFIQMITIQKFGKSETITKRPLN